ncbi:putative lipid II flippase FtsW [Paenibacillus polysaccharolyticus]|uniref:Probable peptidoglycan glycosyltransferase FtsW n=2 Tax=Paenibacillus TaxID=44249 RepID=A0A1G5KPV5_9BACL|nr:MULTISPECIES: putative lipid II flippase FtsW [Paenibacillus]MBY0204485.1 putative lipid II flippase FtsW [Paenibacillus cucumis (ex Kampfer et al. 2016)]MCP1132825.1 putative lipid II flippase FtsW [Paenibacillus polysaccharolyticus]MDP9699550.1 cell division protein FtsW [Paenibacillus intestini]SCZ01979.1 cell division protein FtsW [Paenibacillus polysaccharolyticus]
MKQQTAQTRTKRGTPDFQLLILTLLLVGFGLVMVFSSSSSIAIASESFNNDALYFTKKQLMWAMIGLVGMFFAMNIRFNKYKKLYAPFFLFTTALLLVVLVSGAVLNGARSWIRVFGFSLQPAEFAKIAIILYLSALITKKGERFRDFKTGYFPVLFIVGFIAGLIMLQPDFGTCFILVSTCGLVIYAGGANMKHILGSILLVALGGALAFGASALFSSMSPDTPALDSTTTVTAEQNYKIGRIQAFLNPESDINGGSLNLYRSLVAIGDGGITGSGIGQGTMKLHYLPNAYNDFIFSVIGEELGFIGSALFLLIYLYFIWRGIIVSLRCPDPFGTLVGIGIMGLIAIQAFINIGGVTQTIPVTGVTLPFISYGGTSLFVMMVAMGIVLSISRTNNLEAIKEQKTKSVTVQTRTSPALRSRDSIRRVR